MSNYETIDALMWATPIVLICVGLYLINKKHKKESDKDFK